MAAALTGLGYPRTVSPTVYRCACGCGAYASRGVPSGAWYAPACLPPHLRCAHEPEYRPLAAAVPTPAAPPRAPDLLSGLAAS